MEQMRGCLLWLVVILFVVVICGGLVGAVILHSSLVVTKSMEPSLHWGDRVVSVPLFGRNVSRGMVVYYRPPTATDTEVTVLGRVIGLPGDRVRVRAGKVELNGKPLNEPYFKQASEGPGMNFPTVPDSYAAEDVRRLQTVIYGEWVANGVLKVPDDYYFILGDNRRDAVDSRTYGPVQRSAITGQPICVYKSSAAGSNPRLIENPNLTQ